MDTTGFTFSFTGPRKLDDAITSPEASEIIAIADASTMVEHGYNFISKLANGRAHRNCRSEDPNEAPYRSMRLLITLTIIAFTTISGWIVAFQMRRRMRRTLGRKVTDRELVSITTWMKVTDQEERDKQNRPVTPK